MKKEPLLLFTIDRDGLIRGTMEWNGDGAPALSLPDGHEVIEVTKTEYAAFRSIIEKRDGGGIVFDKASRIVRRKP